MQSMENPFEIKIPISNPSRYESGINIIDFVGIKVPWNYLILDLLPFSVNKLKTVSAEVPSALCISSLFLIMSRVISSWSIAFPQISWRAASKTWENGPWPISWSNAAYRTDWYPPQVNWRCSAILPAMCITPSELQTGYASHLDRPDVHWQAAWSFEAAEAESYLAA